MNKSEIKYDQEFEVSEAQYNVIMNDLSGTCAGRKDNGKFFVKLWVMSCKKYIEKALEIVP